MPPEPLKPLPRLFFRPSYGPDRMDLLLQRTLDNSYIHIFMHSMCVMKHPRQLIVTQGDHVFRAKPPSVEQHLGRNHPESL